MSAHLSPHPLVLSVGQCSSDDYRLARLLQSHHATMDRAATAADALQKIAAHPYALILINRILDDDGTSGIDLIPRARAAATPPAPAPPIMLISNYPDAQAQAIAAGARPGFGKSDLGTPQLSHLLEQSLNPSTAR